jgi:hypothetical protein
MMRHGVIVPTCGECRAPVSECRHGLACCRSAIGPACGHLTVRDAP